MKRLAILTSALILLLVAACGEPNPRGNSQAGDSDGHGSGTLPSGGE